MREAVVNKVVVGIILGLVAIAAIASGCGGGDDDSLTKAEFTRKAEAICTKGQEKKGTALAAGFEEKGKKASSKAVQEELVTDYALPPLDQMTAELAALDPPSEDEEQVEEMIGSYEEALAKMKKDPAIGIAESNPFAEADRMAQQYGLEVCNEI